MSFPYFYGRAAEQYAFYRIPKLLFSDERFEALSTDAKLLYGMLIDRMELSIKNGWTDKDGRVFIYFTLEDARERLKCGTEKIVKLFAELDSEKGIYTNDVFAAAEGNKVDANLSYASLDDIKAACDWMTGNWVK